MYGHAVVFRSFSDLYEEEQFQQRIQLQQRQSPRSLSILLPPTASSSSSASPSPRRKQPSIAWEDLNRFDTRSSASSSCASSTSDEMAGERGRSSPWRRRKAGTGLIGKMLKRASSVSSSSSSRSNASTAATEASVHALCPAPIVKSSLPLQRRSTRSSSFYAETLSDHGDDEAHALDRDFPSYDEEEFAAFAMGQDLSLQRFPAKRRQ